MKIILFRGRPGTGKTTLTHALGGRTHFPILRKDDIHDPVSMFIPEHVNRSKASYAVLYRILESNIHTDVTFILDFSFQTKGDFSVINDWCKERGVTLKSVLVTCTDEELWAERFNKRADNPAPNQTITNFEGLKKHYGTLQLALEEGELLIDTVRPIEGLLEEVAEFL